MKTDVVIVQRFDADENKVFDWADLTQHISIDEEGNEVQEHLYAKTLFLATGDTINNYVEIDAPAVDEI